MSYSSTDRALDDELISVKREELEEKARAESAAKKALKPASLSSAEKKQQVRSNSSLEESPDIPLGKLVQQQLQKVPIVKIKVPQKPNARVQQRFQTVVQQPGAHVKQALAAAQETGNRSHTRRRNTKETKKTISCPEHYFFQKKCLPETNKKLKQAAKNNAPNNEIKDVFYNCGSYERVEKEFQKDGKTFKRYPCERKFKTNLYKKVFDNLHEAIKMLVVIERREYVRININGEAQFITHKLLTDLKNTQVGLKVYHALGADSFTKEAINMYNIVKLEQEQKISPRKTTEQEPECPKHVWYKPEDKKRGRCISTGAQLFKKLKPEIKKEVLIATGKDKCKGPYVKKTTKNNRNICVQKKTVERARSDRPVGQPRNTSKSRPAARKQSSDNRLQNLKILFKDLYKTGGYYGSTKLFSIKTVINNRLKANNQPLISTDEWTELLKLVPKKKQKPAVYIRPAPIPQNMQ